MEAGHCSETLSTKTDDLRPHNTLFPVTTTNTSNIIQLHTFMWRVRTDDFLKMEKYKQYSLRTQCGTWKASCIRTLMTLIRTDVISS
jgi:hypothetical protein